MLLLVIGCTGDVSLKTDTGDTGDSAVDSDTGTDTEETGEWPSGDPDLLCQVEMSCPGGVVDEPKHPCDLRIVSGDGAVVYDAMAMVEIRGRSSSEFPKAPYGVELHRSAAWLVPPQATWFYLDGDQPAPDGWQDPDFSPSGWDEGMAPLGYGDTVSTTIVGGASAARFRADFEVADPAAVPTLELSLVRDDGAEVWINGQSVLRTNLAEGAEWATTKVDEEFEDDWLRWDLDPGVLVAGRNTIAVEVHQSDAGSSDLRFDASLLASGGRETPNLFDMGGEDDWILNSAYVDRVLWRNKLAYDLFQSFGGKERWAAEQVFCELTRDGEYEGVYLLGESPRRDDDRVDIPEDDGAASNFLVKLSEEGGFTPNTVGYGEWEAVYPKQSEENEASLPPIEDELVAWETLLLAGDEAQWEHADLDSAVDWVIIEELFKNSDAYYLSINLWRDESSRLRFIPWDIDLSLGYPYTDCGATDWVWRNELPTGLSASPAFKARLVERWAELRQGPLSDATILGEVDHYESIMGDAIARNFERWPVDEIKFGWGDEDNWLCPAETWEEEHDRVLAWIPDRTAWLDEHIGEY